MDIIQTLKTKRLFIILLFLSVVMIFGTGCSVFSRKNLSRGEIIDSRPHGRLKPGEIDNMSGTKNIMPPKKNEKSGRKAEKLNEKSGKTSKKSDEKNNNQGHWQTKKSMRKYGR